MGKSLVAKNGNDRIMTPPELGKKIINYFNPSGNVLEPCMGDGTGFFQWLINKENIKSYGLEIDLGLDFFDFHKKVDWIITNPPYSLYSKFLEHAFSISDNVAFLYLIPGIFYKKRLRLLKQYGFKIEEIIYINTPKSFPQFGFQMGVVHYRKGNQETIKISDWTDND